ATTCATDVYDEILNTTIAAADLLPTFGGDGVETSFRNSGGEAGFGARDSVLQEAATNVLPGDPHEQYQREAER
ncbi:unnamed protein product, partial [Ectocarpus fasciculatus]